MPEVYVLQHEACETLGTIEQALLVRGITPRTILSFAGEPIPKQIGSLAGLIVMGGPMGAYQQDKYPFLADEAKLIADAVSHDVPVLGVCLGAQLVAQTLGANVKYSGRQEIGWYPLHLKEESQHDPIWHGIESGQMAFHWHGDIFDLPPDAVSLAYSDLTPCQAFRFNANVYGLQCHLEVTPRMLESWTSEFTDSLSGAGIQGDDILAYAPEYLPGMQAMARTVFSRWADLISE